MRKDPLWIAKVVDLVEPNSRVLDLGCGKGDVLERLQAEKRVHGYGIDIEFDNILSCTKKGIAVFQGDIDEGLKEFGKHAFDYVILSQTLQQVKRPLFVLSEMLRVGRRGIIIVPNFAHWRIRLQLLFGMTPRTGALPYHWYNTPNIRVVTIQDFHAICAKKGYKIVKEVPIHHNVCVRFLIRCGLSNILSTDGLFVIEKC
jgi:methionine biosynthesis protein MetW